MAPITRGLMKAKIRRQNVLEVIKPRDHVFLGHQIPDCQVSANLREEIVRRAVKCTEKPSLVFDYHYRCVNTLISFFHSYGQDKLRVLLQHDTLRQPTLNSGSSNNKMPKRCG